MEPARTGHGLRWWGELPTRNATLLDRWPGRVIALALLALHAALVWVGRDPGLLTRSDDTRYLFLARALRAGTYRDLMWVDTPLHHMYPPGYPALLALWTAIGGEGFDWLVTHQILLSIAALSLTLDAMRRVLPPIVVVGALALLAVNPGLLIWVGQVSSEPALALCAALAIWGSVALPAGRARDTVVLVAAIAAPFMRGAGIVLPAAVVLHLLLARRFRGAAVAAVISMLVVGPLMWWVLNDPYTIVGSSYAADIVAPSSTGASMVQTLIERLRVNTVFYLSRGLPWLLPLPRIAGTIVDNVIGSVVLIAALLAGSITAFTRFRMAFLIALGTAGLLLLWVWQDDRFLVPALVAIVPVIVLGVWRLGAARSAAVSAALVTAFSLSIIGAAARRDVERLRAYGGCDRSGPMPDPACLTPAQRGYFEAVRFVRDSLPRNARLLSAKSVSASYYSGRLSEPYQRYDYFNDADFWRLLGTARVEYLLLSNMHALEPARLAPRLATHCQSIELVGAFSGNTFLFKARGAPGSDAAAASSATPGGACEAVQSYLAAALSQAARQ